MPISAVEFLKGTGIRSRIEGMCAAISDQMTKKAQAKKRKEEAEKLREEKNEEKTEIK